MGNFFVIDGVDGSGKGTQTRLLVDTLQEEGYDVLEVDFPQYGKPSAALVEMYLNGEFGSSMEVTPYQASIFYACDRFARSKEMKDHLTKGGIIISNRYVSSNQIHQAGKIADEVELDKFLAWLDELEFEIFKIPRPDSVLFLNVPYEMGQELVGKKEQRAYLKGGKTHDLHEEDKNHLRDAYHRACSLVQKYAYWHEITCTKDGELRSVEDIAQEIYAFIEKQLN